MKKILSLSFVALFIVIFTGCSTTRSKSDVKGIKKLYHNTTSKFNGYFNAKELMNTTKLELDATTENNYNKILPVFDYIELDNPTAIAPNMDKAIEKVITVATIHDFSNYVDDCYVLMGEAQYMKQDYASAEETFQYFEEEFDPLNPYGREYSKAKFKRKSPKERRKELDAERKEKDKERKAEEKERDEQRKIEEKAREAERKARSERSKKSKKKKKRTKKRPSERPTKEEVEEKKSDPSIMTREEREAARAVEKAAKEEQEAQEKFEKEKQKLEEEKAEQKEKENRPQGEGAVLKNKTAFYEGLYWLARTYIETERFSAAKNVLDRLENTDPLSEDVANKLPAVKAHMYIRTGEMDAALVALDEAIELEKERKLRARYAFIKGQIYEQQDNAALAYTEYKRAKKFSPNYEMEFNAELNELKLSYKTGQTSKQKALKKLEKMSKEAKNLAYLDQLYFTQGQIKLNSNDIAGAMADFNEAVSIGGGNKNVKLEANYKLAELLYNQGLYRDAKKNYDAAVKAMPITDDRYATAKRLADNLTDIAKNIEIVNLQDSLLKLSMMSEEELKDMARANIEERKANGENLEVEQKRTSNILSGSNRRSQGLGKTNFFAYNPLALNQGKAEFKKTWGTRVLEDNWRRSLRTDVGSSVDEQVAEEVEPDAITDEEVANYLRDVPSSDTQKRASNLKIQNALFQLGILFRERLRNYERSVESLERLIREYPDFEKRDEALFYLYLSYRDLGDNTQATLVLNKLKTEFPDSNFTKLATDPNYAKSMKKDEGNINTYYDRTYKLFENGNYGAVIERAEEKSNLFKGKTDYDARFDLLTAMSIGSTKGKEEYVKQLQNLIRKHKNTPEEVRAKEILRFLKGDQEAFNEILYDETKDKFTLDDNKLHYIFVVVYDKDQSEMQNLKIAISDYNKKYHRRDNLKISNISLNPESKSQIILIRSYNDGKEPAMAYYNGVLKNKREFITRQNADKPSKPSDFDIYVATQKNYREVVKQRSVNEYRVFFEKEYLEK